MLHIVKTSVPIMKKKILTAVLLYIKVVFSQNSVLSMLKYSHRYCQNEIDLQVKIVILLWPARTATVLTISLNTQVGTNKLSENLSLKTSTVCITDGNQAADYVKQRQELVSKIAFANRQDNHKSVPCNPHPIDVDAYCLKSKVEVSEPWIPLLKLSIIFCCPTISGLLMILSMLLSKLC